MPTISITFNGHKGYPVTNGLKSALCHLRDETKIVIIWVDALCINQQDNAEKLSQVSSMRYIYSTVRDTCIWLGEEADNSNYAVDLISNLDER